MKSLSSIIILSIAFLFLGCQSKPAKQERTMEDNKLPVLDIAAQVFQSVPDTFTWNSIAKHIRILPLQTRQLIGRGLSINYISDDMILMNEGQSQRIFIFDANGKEKHSFKHIGNGPGEYIYLTYVDFNKTDSTIIVYDNSNSKVINYSLEGKYRNEIKTGFFGNLRFRDKVGVFYTINAAGAGLAGVLSASFSMEKTCLPFDSLMTDKQKVTTLLMSNNSVTRDKFLLNPVYSDTLYSISKEGATPFCVLQKGKHILPKEELNDVIRLIKEKNDYFIRMQFNTFLSHLYVDYTWQGKYTMELWDLQRETIIAKEEYSEPKPEEKVMYGFNYIFPSGKKIKLRPHYSTHNRLAFIIEAEDCVDEIDGLKEDDNPVLLILDL